MFLPLLVAVPFGPLLAWKRGDLVAAAQRLIAAGIAALLALAFVMAWTRGGAVLAPLAIALAAFVIVGALCDLAEKAGVFRLAPSVSLRRAAGLPRSTWGTAFAHAGLGVALLGVVCETNWNSERIVAVKPGEVVSIGAYQASFEGLIRVSGPNYREHIARFTIMRDAEKVGELSPSKRMFAARGASTTEAALLTHGFSQLYLSLGDQNADGSLAVRAYDKPLVLLIWYGTVMMAFGGMLSLSDRRLRVGAPKPARGKQRLQPAE